MYYDLTMPISEDMHIYDGDPKPKIAPVSNIEDDLYSLHILNIHSHLGTHLDFPSHFIKNGKSSSDYPVDYFFGNVIIGCCDFICNNIVDSIDYIFIDNPLGLENSKLDEIIDYKPKIIGINSMSIDKSGFDNHIRILKSEILILENLVLDKVDYGIYKSIILPIKINDMDGLPCRTIVY